MLQATDSELPRDAGQARPGYRIGGTTGAGWKPGQSGNPKGRADERRYKGMTLPQLARTHTEIALRALAGIVNNPKELTTNRIAAANVILQRGWGDVPREAQAGGELRVIVETVTADPSAPRLGVIRMPDDPRPLSPLVIEADARDLIDRAFTPPASDAPASRDAPWTHPLEKAAV